MLCSIILQRLILLLPLVDIIYSTFIYPIPLLTIFRNDSYDALRLFFFFASTRSTPTDYLQSFLCTCASL